MSRLLGKYIEEFTWDEIRDSVEAVNKPFAEALDELNPSKRYTVFKITYPYGSMMVDKGQFQVPISKDECVPIQDVRVHRYVRSQLQFDSVMPLGLVLKKTLELFIEFHNRLIPQRILSPGDFIGLDDALCSNRSLNKGHIWNVSSGARTTFMLPRISDNDGYLRLRRDYDRYVYRPGELLDHWHIFRQLAFSSINKTSWRNEVLFFPKIWFAKKTSRQWRLLRCFMLESLISSKPLRNRELSNMLLGMMNTRLPVKHDPTIRKTAMHLFDMGAGLVPGMGLSNENLMPYEFLQKAFVESYGLRKYAPIIFAPSYVGSDPMKPLYYSIQFPTVLDFLPDSCRKPGSGLDRLRELRSILEVLAEETLENALELDDCPYTILGVVKRTDYDFYHHDKDYYGVIKPSSELIKMDVNLQDELARHKNKELALASPFLRGCVRMGAKEEDGS